MNSKLEALFLSVVLSAAIVIVLIGLGFMLWVAAAALLEGMQYPHMVAMLIAAVISTILLTTYTYKRMTND